MSVAVDDSIRELQQRVRGMEGTSISRTLPTHPALAPLVTLRTGIVCSVDSLSLVLLLLSAASQAGEWSAVVGVPDLGWEAAEQHGVDLARTVAVPRPGEHWLSVTAGMVDVATVVVVKPPATVTEHQAARLASRLRQRDAMLIAVGHWPRAALRLTSAGESWAGLGSGHGYLGRRRTTVTVASGTAPSRRCDLWLPDADQQVRVAEPEPTVLAAVRAG